MQHGFIKVAAITPKIRVADPYYNAKQICEAITDAERNEAKLIVFPELCITGYTCQDLFLQESLLSAAKDALRQIIAHTDGVDSIVFVGLPYEKDHKLYNVAAVINGGELMGFVPKTSIPMYGEFYEGRHFEAGNDTPVMVMFDDYEVPFGTDILFESDALPGLSIAVEICEDVWGPNPPSTRHALAGASIIVNLSASNETVCKDDYRRMLISATSARLVCGYIYCSAGDGESTQDLVFGGHNMIAENGSILAEAERFQNEGIMVDLDVAKICAERRRMTSYQVNKTPEYMVVPCALIHQTTILSREFSKTPFVPSGVIQRDKRCEDILNMQSMGLKKRYEHTGCKNAVVGLSGGLDSTLALLVTVRAFDMLGLTRENIITVTMPCFGTTDRTYDNACKLAQTLGTTLKTVDIKKSVRQHFEDIGQDEEKHDVTYENGQARERTQILMDIANQCGGLVIGTGDMSELALGWATYNGDHMSMYGVNASVPKTLVRHLVRFYADTCGTETLQNVLLDVLDTPVSPELLPPENGTISQKTEDLVGPYELHDFTMYYMLRFGFAPDKIYRLAVQTFADEYDKETILKWLKVFYKRFFAQHFKRSCLPDGPKVGSVAVSPRGDLRMPSDASASLWLGILEDDLMLSEY